MLKKYIFSCHQIPISICVIIKGRVVKLVKLPIYFFPLAQPFSVTRVVARLSAADHSGGLESENEIIML